MGTKSPPRPPVTRQPGYLRRLFKEPQPVLDELRGRYGPICELGAGPVRIAIVGDPTLLRELYGMPTDDFRWGHKFNVLGFVVGDESMIVSDGADHRRRRGAVQAAFSRRRLNGWIPMIVERTDGAIDALQLAPGAPARVVDLSAVGRTVVLDVVVRSLFGERMAARAGEIGELFRRPQAYLEAPAVRQFPHRVPHTARARVREDRRALDAIVDAEIAARRAQPSDDALDVLQTLVDGGQLSDDEIRDQVITLIGAGFDTTSATLAWMVWRSVLTPGVWDRLRAEADTVLGPLAAATATARDESTLAGLRFANRVMRETTRLHPAGVINPREAAADIVVGGYTIRRGTLILLSAHLAGRDRDAWNDPLCFDPDRFDPARTEQLSAGQRALSDIAWVPFGRGARNCIGFALAQMELTLIIARLAQRLDAAAPAVSASTPRGTDSVPTPRGTVSMPTPRGTVSMPTPRGMVVNRPTGGAPMAVASRS